MLQALDIHTAADLDQLHVTPSAFAPIRVHLPRLNSDQRTQTGRRLTSLAQECGCGAGGIAAMLALLSCAPITVFAWWFGAVTVLQGLVSVLGIMAVAALLGKLWILARSRQQLRAEISVLRAIA